MDRYATPRRELRRVGIAHREMRIESGIPTRAISKPCQKRGSSKRPLLSVGGAHPTILDMLRKLPSPARRAKSGAIKKVLLIGDDLNAATHFLNRVTSMQNAELYRRGIVLPLDEAAEEALCSNHVSETTNVRLLKIPDAEWFEALWRLGLFREINARCATLLDDHEEEMMDAASADGVIAAVDVVARDAIAEHSEMVEFLDDLREMARQALRSSRPLLFVL